MTEKLSQQLIDVQEAHKKTVPDDPWIVVADVVLEMWVDEIKQLEAERDMLRKALNQQWNGAHNVGCEDARYYHLYCWGAAYYCADCHKREYPDCKHPGCEPEEIESVEQCDLSNCPHRSTDTETLKRG